MPRHAGGENKNTTALIDAAISILAEQNPMTIRQLFYRLVSKSRVPNNLASYQMVSRIMTKCRDDGRCPFAWIADRSRPVYAAKGFDDAVEYAAVMRDGYRKNYWTTQPEHIEIWVEKDAIIGSIQDVCDELGVTIRVGRGYWSTTAAHEIAEIFAGITKPITVFYCGDHDPSGQNIQSELYDRILNYGVEDFPTFDGLSRFLDRKSGTATVKVSPFYFTMKRLAINKEDITKFNLPPLVAKSSDPRTSQFVREHGNQCVELDALPPVELRRRIEEAVRLHIDDKLWKVAEETEKKENARIQDAVNQWSSMTDEDAPSWEAFKALQEDNPVMLMLLQSQPDIDLLDKPPLVSVYPPLVATRAGLP